MGPYGCDIQNKAAAAVGADHDLTLPGMDHQVMHRGGREVIAQGEPESPSVQGHIHAHVGAQVQDVRGDRILTDDVYGFGGQAA